MKKPLLMAMTCLIFSLMGNAVDYKLTIQSSEAQYREVLSEMLSFADCASAANLFNRSRFGLLSNRKELDSLRLDADAALASKGIGVEWMAFKSWPKLSANARKKFGADALYKNSLALCKKYNTDMNLWLFAHSGATIDELVPCINEILTFPEKYPYTCSMVDYAKRGMQKAAVVGVRKALRKQGKSFVSANGINPCEEYMNRLNVALNAPRFVGLNEWLQELGFATRLDGSLLPTKEEVDKLKDAVFYGEQEMTHRNRSILYICLGVEGFNAFAKEYNGEK